MYNISDSQVDFIIDDIKKRGVELEDLQDNLLDHVCCIIENELSEKESFYKFYEDTISKFYKKELVEIEEETKNLLIFKNFYVMKRTMKIVGILSTVLVVLGTIFKLMHWPGAGVGLTFGIGIFGLIFMPLLIALKYKDGGQRKEKIIFSIGFLAGIIGIIGMLFRIQHWPGASLLIEVSIASFVVVFVPLFFINGYKQADKRFNTMITSFLILVGASAMFLQTTQGLTIGIKTSLNEVYSHLKTNTKKTWEINGKLYSEIKERPDGLVLVQKESKKLYDEIEELKILLISKTEEVDLETASKMSLQDFQNPGNARYVGFFLYGHMDYSYEDLAKSIKTYNSEVGKLVSQALSFKKETDWQTTLPIYLHQLTQVQQQIMNNENSYLNFVKGEIKNKVEE